MCPIGRSAQARWLAALSVLAWAASATQTQQWIGPSEATGWAILFKPSCDGSGKNCKKCVSAQFGHGDDIFIQDCDGGADQQWQYEFLDSCAQTNGCGILHLKQHWEYCALIWSGKAGSKLQLSACDEAAGNGWLPSGDFQLQAVDVNGKYTEAGFDCLKPTCMDLPGGDTTNGKPLQLWDCTWSPSGTGLIGHRYWFNVTVGKCYFENGPPDTYIYQAQVAITFRHENAVDLCQSDDQAHLPLLWYAKTFVSTGKQPTWCDNGWNCWTSSSSKFSDSNQQRWVGTAWTGNSSGPSFQTNFSVACGGSDCNSPGFSLRARGLGWIAKMPFDKGKEDLCAIQSVPG
jgi:hypothetical protein